MTCPKVLWTRPVFKHRQAPPAAYRDKPAILQGQARKECHGHELRSHTPAYAAIISLMCSQRIVAFEVPSLHPCSSSTIQWRTSFGGCFGTVRLCQDAEQRAELLHPGVAGFLGSGRQDAARTHETDSPPKHACDIIQVTPL